MTKQEEIREYFESGLCSNLSQEYCSGCKFTRKNGDYCEDVHSQVSETLNDLSDLGVVVKVEEQEAKVGEPCVLRFSLIEPLVFLKK